MSMPSCLRPPERGSPHESLNSISPSTGQTQSDEAALRIIAEVPLRASASDSRRSRSRSSRPSITAAYSSRSSSAPATCSAMIWLAAATVRAATATRMR